MKTRSAGFAPLIIIALIALVIAGAGVSAYVVTSTPASPTPAPVETPQPKLPVPRPVPHTPTTVAATTSVSVKAPANSGLQPSQIAVINAAIGTSTQSSDELVRRASRSVPSNIVAIAQEYLVSRLGNEYVKNNVVVDPVQDGNQNGWYIVRFTDTKLTAAAGAKDIFHSTTYRIHVTQDGIIDPAALDKSSVAPNCVTTPDLCVMHVSIEQAVAQAAKLGYPYLFGINIGGDTWCTKNSTVASTEGFFWLFQDVPLGYRNLQINISTGKVNNCTTPEVGDF